jgi:16S rRNA (uracil1498-N3)-methyltransferase
MDYSLVPYELAEGMEATKDALSNIKPGMDVAVFIGPEGGFDITEIDEACNKGMTPISLGKRILRTETAGLAVMSIIMYHLEIGE